MKDFDDAEYRGGETTGFQSPAQDHIEHVIDLSDVLDLRKPGMYPVRVVGQAFRERGILDGDILIANAAADLRRHWRDKDESQAGKLSGKEALRLQRRLRSAICDLPTTARRSTPQFR